jgi:hypothetical protein
MSPSYCNGNKIVEDLQKDTLESKEIIDVSVKFGYREGVWEFYDQNGNIERKCYKDCEEQKNQKK